MLKKILVLCFCLALLAGSACAETVAPMPGHNLEYRCTLPDAWTYPEIQPRLLEELRRRGEL